MFNIGKDIGRAEKPMLPNPGCPAGKLAFS
jgi:hypothetical protein